MKRQKPVHLETEIGARCGKDAKARARGKALPSAKDISVVTCSACLTLHGMDEARERRRSES